MVKIDEERDSAFKKEAVLLRSEERVRVQGCMVRVHYRAMKAAIWVVPGRQGICRRLSWVDRGTPRELVGSGSRAWLEGGYMLIRSN